MQTNDFYKNLTSGKLQENLAKQFNTTVNIDKYNREELEDIRNRLRTKLFQQEGVAKINELLTNETYQKDKAMLQLLNTRIKEMLGEHIQKLRDKMIELSESKKGFKNVKHSKGSEGTKGSKGPGAKKDEDDKKKTPPKKKDEDDKKKTPSDKKKTPPKESTGWKSKFKFDTKDTKAKNKKVTEEEFNAASETEAEAEAAREAEAEAARKAAPKYQSGELSQAMGGGLPTTPGQRKFVAGNAQTQAGARTNTRDGARTNDRGRKTTTESQELFRDNIRIVNNGLIRMLKEDEEGKAKTITSASDMVNDFTSWMQRVGQFQTKVMIELADAIRADFGVQESETFKQSIGPALSATLETLTQQRETISNAVAVLAGEDTAQNPMGMEPQVGPGSPSMDQGMEPSEPDMMNPAGNDEFGASEAAAGGAEVSGREMRESRFARKLAESHSLMSRLSK